MSTGEHEYAENKRDTPERWRRTVDAIVSAVDMACERVNGCERGGCERIYKLSRDADVIDSHIDDAEGLNSFERRPGSGILIGPAGGAQGLGNHGHPPTSAFAARRVNV